MKSKFQRQKAPEGLLFSLNAAIYTVDQARDTTSVKPAKGAFESASLLLTTIRVRFIPAHVGRSLTYVQDSTIVEVDCVEVGLTCAEVCQSLDRGIDGGRQKQLSQPVLEAIERLKT